MSPSDSLHISLFGTLGLRRGAEHLALPASSDARSVLVFLALSADRPHTRSALVERFWEGLSESRARRALSQALWHLKRSVPDLVEANATHVGLNPELPVEIDADRFERLVAPHLDGSSELTASPSQRAIAELYEADALYRGDLLEDFDAYWVLIERERLRELYARTLNRLVSLEKAASRYQAALNVAMKLVSLDPLREEASREAMRLLFLLKRPLEALQVFRECQRQLEEELGIEPDAETRALAEAIAQRSEKKLPPVFLPELPAEPSAVSRPQDQLPLIGRQRERSAMLLLVEALFRGQSGLLLLDGEAGVGKTRLVEELIRDAEWRGLRPLLGSCDDVESSPPYEPLVEALSAGLSPLRAEQLAHLVSPVSLSVLAPLLPALATGSPGLGQAPLLAGPQHDDRLKHAFSETIFAWARATPLIIVLEDLQWADDDTMALLTHLVQTLENVRTGHHGVLLFGTFRLAEARSRPSLWDSLQALDRSALATRLSIGPLDADQTAELMRTGLGYRKPAPLFEGRLYGETEGNPLFVLETLRALQEKGQLVRDANGIWSTPFDETTTDYAEMAIPSAVEWVIQSRLEGLSPDLRRAIASATVLGREFDFALLSSISDLGPEKILQAVQQLKQRRFLDESPESFRFSHAKIRQVAYLELADDQRLDLHRRAASSLEAHERKRLESLAHHCIQGRIWDKAITYSVKAAEQAETLCANHAALAHCDRALQILEQHAPFSRERRGFLEFDLLERRARLYWLTGQPEAQERDIKKLQRCAAALNVPERIARAFNEMSYFLCNVLDQYDTAEKAASVALDYSRKHQLTRQAARALETLGLTHQYRDQLAEAERSFEEALATWAALEPMSGHVARIRTELARVYWKQRRLDEAEVTCSETLELARELEDYLTLTQLYKMLAVFASKRTDYQTALQHDGTALSYARAAGTRQIEATILANQALTLRELGELGQAIRQMREALQLELKLASRRGVVMACYNLSVLLLEVGQLDEARQVLDMGLAKLRAIDLQSAELLFPSCEVLWAMESGKPEAALTIGEEALERARALDMTYHAAQLAMNLGRALRRLGRTAEALKHLEQALEIWHSIGEVAFTVLTRSFIADCQRQLGRLDLALEPALQATRDLGPDDSGELPQAAHYALARILNERGESTAAAEALGRAERSIERQMQTLPSEDERQRYLRTVAINREILEFVRVFRERAHGKTVAARLPSIGAPLGRALRDDDWVDVRWTVETEADRQIRSKVERRHRQIRRLLIEARDQGAAPTHAQIAEALRVSCRTVERDMSELRKAFPDLPGTRRQL